MKMLNRKLEKRSLSICVVGMGYVGRPLAEAFAGVDFDVYGYDIKTIDGVGVNKTNEARADVVICCLPTPVGNFNRPDLEYLNQFSLDVSKHVRKETVIIFESTVAPGTTELMIERIEKLSKKKIENYGYSPERINPGDKVHTLLTTTKLVSGNNKESLDFISNLYETICVNVHKCPTIKVAEAAKIIENTQRDINIALMNEFSMILSRDGIDTLDVLEAANTKWNFMNVKPGLVGGHCIGVDPYYLADYASKLDVRPEVILSGRQRNEEVVNVIANEIMQLAKNEVFGSHLSIHFEGITFKGNCKDTRNSKTQLLFNRISERLPSCKLTTADAFLNPRFNKVTSPSGVDVLVLTVNHDYIDQEFVEKRNPAAVIDLHGIVDRDWARKTETYLWRP